MKYSLEQYLTQIKNVLHIAHTKTMHSLCSGVSEGENEVAGRVRFLAKFKQPKAIALGTIIVVVACVAVFCLGGNNPITTAQSEFDAATSSTTSDATVNTQEQQKKPTPEETDSEQIAYADYAMEDQIFIDNPTRYASETFYDLMMETPILLNGTEILLGQTPFSALSQSDWIVVDQTEASSDIECDANSFQTLTLQRTETQNSWKDPVDGSPYSIGVALFNESNTAVAQSDTKIAAVAFRNIPSSYLITLADGDSDDIGPTITILNGLTLGCTIEDIVAVLGSPTGIWYGDCTWLGTNDAGDHVSLTLQFAEDGTLINFLLCYSHHMFNQ